MIKSILLVDDNPSVLTSLQRALSQIIEVKSFYSCSTISEATNILNNNSIDLVLLDVELEGDESGFDLFKYFPNPNFEFIFVTGFEKYAIQALRLSAADYILKPVNSNELALAILKVEKKSNKIKSSDVVDSLKTNYDLENPKITVLIKKGYTRILVKDIIRCAGKSNYTNIFMTDGTSILSTKTLKHYENLLKDFGFFRINKNDLINTKFIKTLLKGRYPILEIEDGTQLIVSDRKRTLIRKMIFK